jgi:hypothetical protein
MGAGIVGITTLRCTSLVMTALMEDGYARGFCAKDGKGERSEVRSVTEHRNEVKP